MTSTRPQRIAARVETLARIVALGSVFGLAVLGTGGYVAVNESSQPEFCSSCHIMEPYYDSWERSAHSDVTCIECHFDPGVMGSLQGKFQALTQLTKYVTRTAGTRPWAHVSDASCTGCHPVAELEGPLDFGGIAFDHGPHLLHARGKRLQCVTCHSQVQVDQHFAIQTTVCFSCHFMPGPDGAIPERTGDCMLCHGPPEGVLEVAGAPFVHAEWVKAGVDCRTCHADAVAGTGTVHAQRCKSCHGEPELLARIDSPELLHRIHVTAKKVECFECHVEIAHGLSPRGADHPRGGRPPEGAGECASCHSSVHGPAFSVYAGTGAVGIEDQPSRMHSTRVACEACHTGRVGSGAARGGWAHPGGAPSGVALAGEADCLHCHGVAFAGMLGRWQSAVGGGLDALGPLADELRGALAALGGEGPPEAEQLLAEAGHNLGLLRADGSRGAHNLAYSLDALRDAAARLDAAWAMLEPGRELGAGRALPAPADAACVSCHVAVELGDPLVLRGAPFHHEPHLRAGLDCASCHVSAPLGAPGHGQPSFARTDCASCHHQVSELVPAPWDCSSCHATQLAFLEGTLPGLAGVEAPMAEKGCEDCHGEPPDLRVPGPSLCALCHGAGYGELLDTWRAGTAQLTARLEEALAAAGPGASEGALEAARRALALIAADGSQGVHAFPITEALLLEALERLGAR